MIDESTEISATHPVHARTLIGEVVSARMDKTVVVVVERKIPHPKYRKYVKRRTRLFAHDSDNQSHVGDRVLIRAHRPISKRKHWTLVSILNRDSEALPQEVEA